MSDSFCTPYDNPRTGNRTFGAAAQNGRIKTLGGMDKIIETVTSDVTKTLLDLANNNQQSKKV